MAGIEVSLAQSSHIKSSLILKTISYFAEVALILSLPPVSVSLGNNVVIDVFMIGNNYTDNIIEPH